VAPVVSWERTAWAIPPNALTEWLTLAALVDEIGAVPWPLMSGKAFGERWCLTSADRWVE
jgi:hypothetical protein